jgi:thioredoxin-like negative regulator of GroEL
MKYAVVKLPTGGDLHLKPSEAAELTGNLLNAVWEARESNLDEAISRADKLLEAGRNSEAVEVLADWLGISRKLSREVVAWADEH